MLLASLQKRVDMVEHTLTKILPSSLQVGFYYFIIIKTLIFEHNGL